MLSLSSRKKLINASILSGAFIFACSILIVFVYLTKNSLSSGLKQKVEQTVERYEKGGWKIYNQVEFKLQTAASLFVYRCSKVRGDNSDYYAVILRISTISGAAPAVFLCRKGQAVFAGYAFDNGKMEDVMSRENSATPIKYWEKELPLILKKAGLFNEK